MNLKPSLQLVYVSGTRRTAQPFQLR